MLTGRTIILLGAGGGNMGPATTLKLAEAGANIVGVDRNLAAMEGLEDKVAKRGGRFHGIAADVLRTDDLDRIITTAVEAFGGIDGLVNLVGGTQPGHWRPILETPDDLWDEIIDFNLSYAFKSCRAVAKYLIENDRPGSIVNCSSISALTSAPYHSPYGAAKAGLIQLTRSMAVEWGKHNIRVNCLVPSGSRGPRSMANLANTEGRRPSLTALLPRAAEAADFAKSMLFLLSDMSSWLTGSALVADGGMSSQSVLGPPETFDTLVESSRLRR